jgi:hypothetical protein
VTVAAGAAIVSRDRAELVREVRFWYGDDTAREVVVASLPSDERLHVDRHRERADDSDRGR